MGQRCLAGARAAHQLSITLSLSAHMQAEPLLGSPFSSHSQYMQQLAAATAELQQLPWPSHDPTTHPYPCLHTFHLPAPPGTHHPRAGLSQSSLQVYSASLDGTIALWDLQGGQASRVQAYTVGEPVESLVVTPSGAAFVSFHWGAQRAGRVAAFDFGTGALLAERAKTTSPCQLVVSGERELLVERLVWGCVLQGFGGWQGGGAPSPHTCAAPSSHLAFPL